MHQARRGKLVALFIQKMETMKTTHFIGLMLVASVVAASCQKEEQGPAARTAVAPPAEERCGCLPPVELTAKNATDQSIDLVWTPMPESLAYRIEVGTLPEGGERLDEIVFTGLSEQAGHTVSRLTPNTRYGFRITTLCGNDESVASDLKTFETADFPPGDPDGPDLQKIYPDYILQ